MHKCLDRAVMSNSYLTRRTSATSLPKCTFPNMTLRRKISPLCDNTDKLHLSRDVFIDMQTLGCDVVDDGRRYGLIFKKKYFMVTERICSYAFRQMPQPHEKSYLLSQSFL